MTNQTQTQVIAPAEVSALDIIRAEAVSAIIGGYGATRVYAEHLFGWFDSDWFTYAHDDKSEAAKPILAEGDKFRTALRKAGHTNPSVAWTRVRQEGAKLAKAEAEREAGEDGEEGEGESESESAGTKHVRSLTLRLVQDLSTLFKACKREEAKNNLDAKQAQANVHIASALQALGVDLTMVK